MNFFRPTHPRSIHGRWAVCFVGLTVIGLGTGCQKSEPNDGAVVTPPGPSGTSTDEAQSPQHPGSLTLPDDADLGQPQEATPDMAPASGGLELPTDAELDSTGATDPGTTSASDIRFATWPQIQQEATSTGKVTVVDLWSLVCEPCLKEFPGLVRIHQDFGDRVQCIAVDVDFDGRKTRPPETYQDRVTAFIDSVGATFPTYISQTPSDDVYAANNLASIPAVLVYGADGQLVEVFEDAGETAGFSYEEDIIPLVEKLAG